MHEVEGGDPTGLIFRLEDRPGPATSLLAASQHVLASVVAIATPTLVIAAALGLGGDRTAFLVSSALMVSGVATFIQSHRIGPVGSGLFSLQGTSFSFVGAIIAAGLAVKRGAAAPTPFPFKYGLAFDPCRSYRSPSSISSWRSSWRAISRPTRSSPASGQGAGLSRTDPRRHPRRRRQFGHRGGLQQLPEHHIPNTTFSQNNGVIQMTGIASRHVALYVASILLMLGLFPVVGAVFSIIPPSARRDCLCQAVRLTRVDSGGVEHVEPSAGNHG